MSDTQDLDTVTPVEEKETDLSKFEVTSKSLPVKNVTVFQDRAEVNRVIDVDVVPGNMEVLVKELPAQVVEDSIRVTCFGEAKIIEVQFQSKVISDQQVSPDTEKEKWQVEVEAMKNEMKDLSKEKQDLEDTKRLYMADRELLQSYTNSLLKRDKEDRIVDLVEDDKVKLIMSFMETYSTKNRELSKNIGDTNEKLEDIGHKIDVLNENMNKIPDYAKEKKKTERNTSILLESEIKGNVKLVISYVVTNASWQPLYDIRAFNKDNSLQIIYFATIKQSTGENWEEAKISLSTAMPSIGGSPPKLQPQILSEKKPMYPAVVDTKKSVKYKGGRVGTFKKRNKPKGYGSNLKSDGFMDDSSLSEAALPFANLSEGITSTTFEIVRPATIESDDVGHKVSICQLDFQPKFEYFATPKAVAHAFLKVIAKNESQYALLEGPANVFLDNNFLTKSQLSAVSPSEEFEVSLGVDPSIKVTYKPLRKYQQTTGLMSKSTVFSYHQAMLFKNTKAAPVKITITDQFPKSSTDKIKVTLQEPDIKLPKPGSKEDTTMVKHQNVTLMTQDLKIEWVCEIPAAKEESINLRYQVEYPQGLEVEGLV